VTSWAWHFQWEGSARTFIRPRTHVGREGRRGVHPLLCDVGGFRSLDDLSFSAAGVIARPFAGNQGAHT